MRTFVCSVCGEPSVEIDMTAQDRANSFLRYNPTCDLCRRAYVLDREFAHRAAIERAKCVNPVLEVTCEDGNEIAFRADEVKYVWMANSGHCIIIVGTERVFLNTPYVTFVKTWKDALAACV